MTRDDAWRYAWTTGLLACSVVLFSLGFDWVRWIGSIGTAAMVAACAMVLLHGRLEPAARTRGSDAWFRPLDTRSRPVGVLVVVAAAYLLMFPPLPSALRSVDQAVRQFVFVNAQG